jgi:hypothetical protein
MKRRSRLAGKAVMGPLKKSFGLRGAEMSLHGEEMLQREMLELTLALVQPLQR